MDEGRPDPLAPPPGYGAATPPPGPAVPDRGDSCRCGRCPLCSRDVQCTNKADAEDLLCPECRARPGVHCHLTRAFQRGVSDFPARINALWEPSPGRPWPWEYPPRKYPS